jgi:hypothetical protein
MRRVSLFIAIVASGVVMPGFVASAAAAETASASVVVSAQFTGRTSLKVSTDILHFDVNVAGEAATSAVEFSAGARTQAQGEVLLSVEQRRGMTGPDAVSKNESALTFAGQGDGTLEGVVGAASRVVAGRWIGSGLRHGRLLFTMRADTSGTYVVPVRFILSAP